MAAALRSEALAVRPLSRSHGRSTQGYGLWRSAADTDLMEQVGQGCVRSFALLVERHSPSVRRVALRMLGDPAEAEDVLQECFTRLWQQAPGWQSHSAGAGGWLFRIAANLCVDRHRRSRRLVPGAPPERADDGLLPDSVIALREVSLEVRAALADLPRRHREALVLCYFDGLSNLAAARALDLNIKALESLLFRARRRLREILAARGVGTAEVALLTAARGAN